MVYMANMCFVTVVQTGLNDKSPPRSVSDRLAPDFGSC
jgi:hypothetical protein